MAEAQASADPQQIQLAHIALRQSPRTTKGKETSARIKHALRRVLLHCDLLPDYPKHALDIKLLVEGDDVETMAAALAVSGPAHIEVVIVPASAPRTKPKALNVGLGRARGDYVVVYDAEDRPHSMQLRAALAAFEDGDERLAGVQAPLAIDNANASWLARQFAAEYAIQFRELLPLLARMGLPLPLGGTSNHFRVDVLRASGGWDPYNVSEDRENFRLCFSELKRGTLHVPLLSQTCAGAA